MLTDGNATTAWVDVNSSRGMYSWTVSGLDSSQANQLNQQWFWYKIGSGQGIASSIDTIGSPEVTRFGSDRMAVAYSNSTLRVEISYDLTGGGLGQADISEGIKVWNLTANPLDFHFYQYSDFNLLNNPQGDSISIDPGGAYQSKGETQIAESIILPKANRFEASLQGVTLTTFANPGWDGNLSNVSSAGPGDVTWSFQWDQLIGTGTDNQFDVTKDKLLDVTVIPEPSTVGLISLGLAALLARRRGQVL